MRKAFAQVFTLPSFAIKVAIKAAIKVAIPRTSRARREPIRLKSSWYTKHNEKSQRFACHCAKRNAGLLPK